MVFLSLAGVAAVLLLTPPDWQGESRAFFLLGTWLLAAVWWFTAAPSDWQENFALGPPVLALLVAWGLSTIWSSDPARSVNPFTHEVANLLFFLTAFAAARNTRGTRLGFSWLVFAAVLLSLYGIYQSLHGLADTYLQIFGKQSPQGPLEQEVASRLLSHRAFSLLTYPNLFAGLLAMLLPVSLSLAATARRWSRGLWAAAAVLLLLGLAASGSLGGWLAAAAGVGFSLWIALARPRGPIPPGRMRGYALAGVLLILGGAAGILALRGWTSMLADAGDRFANWGSALRMAYDYPLTGVGLGYFGTLFPEYQSEHGYYVRFAHNMLLNHLAETGLAGIFALGWFLVAVWRKLRDGLRQTLSRPRLLLAAGVVGGSMAGLLHACVDVDFQFLKTAMVFWLLLGAGLGLLTLRPLERAGRREHAARTQSQQQTAWWLPYGLGILLILVLWRGGHSLPVEGALYWGAGLLGGVFLLLRWPDIAAGPMRSGPVPLVWPLGFLLVWGTFAAMVSLHPAGAVPGLTLAACGVLIYLLAQQTPAAGTILVKVLPAGAMLFALAGLAELAARPGARITAGWPNPNLLGAFLAMGLLASLALLTSGVKTRLGRILLGCASFIIYAALLATGSLGGFLNLAAGLCLLGAWTWHRRRARFGRAVIVGLVLVLAALILPLSLGRRLLQPGQYAGQAYERLHIALAALQMVKDRPVTGFGPGNFAEAFQRYSFPNVRGLAHYGKQAEFAHNEILQLLAVAGLPGLLLLGWLVWQILFFWRKFWHAPPKTQGAETQATGMKLVAWTCLAGAAAQGLVDFNWHVPALFTWGLALLGTAVAAPREAKIRAVSPAFNPAGWFQQLDAWSRRHTAVVLLVAVVALATAAIRPLVSQYLLRLGEAYRYKSNLKAAARQFERALVVHPLFAEAYDQLGQIRTDFYAAIAADSWFQLAEWAYFKALALDGLDPFVHRHLGQLYALKAAHLEDHERQAELESALRQYHLAIEKAPHQAFLYFELGNLRRDARDLTGAEQAWKEAVALEPNYAGAWSNLGLVQEIQRDYTEAEDSYQRALALRPLGRQASGKYEIELLAMNWAIVHFNYGHLLEHLRRPDEARRQYLQALALEPGNAYARRRLRALDQIFP